MVSRVPRPIRTRVDSSEYLLEMLLSVELRNMSTLLLDIRAGAIHVTLMAIASSFASFERQCLLENGELVLGDLVFLLLTGALLGSVE